MWNQEKSISKNWRNLGKLEEKQIIFQDKIIPPHKRNNRHLKRDGLWIEEKNQKYYFKTREKDSYRSLIIHELVGEKVSEYFGLDTVHFELSTGTIRGKKVYGLLSKWARKEDKKYYMLGDFLNEQHAWNIDGFNILKAIDTTCKNEPIEKEIRALLAREFFTNEHDRQNSEILVEKGPDSIHLGYLSDYEMEFEENNIESSVRLPYFSEIDLQSMKTREIITKDKLLLLQFKKALAISLKEIITEIEDTHKLRITKKEKQSLLDYESRRKEEISSNLKI